MEEKANGEAVREAADSFTVSILATAILFKSVLNRILNHVMGDRLESELELVCYCNAILFKPESVPNCVMYSWVVHFLSYFIPIFREQRRERESRAEGGIVVIELFYFF